MKLKPIKNLTYSLGGRQKREIYYSHWKAIWKNVN